MKVQPARIAAFLARPDPRMPVVLLYGPDAGLVDERAAALARTVVDDPGDPFRVSLLQGEEVRTDPGRLVDEARAQSMIGGRRVVRLRQAGDLATAACRELLRIEGLDSLVLIEAGDLGPSSSLRRLVEQAPSAAAIPCYREEGQGLARSIEALLGERSLRAEPDARDHLVANLGGDRAVTRSEIDKLALYLHGGDGRVRLEDAALLVGDSSALALDQLVDHVLQGEHAPLQATLDRLLGQGVAPASILRALIRQYLQLLRLAGRVAAGERADSVVASARPPVHFRRKPRLMRALARWRPAAIEAALGRLLETEVQIRTTALPAETVCRQALLELARVPGGRGGEA